MKKWFRLVLLILFIQPLFALSAPLSSCTQLLGMQWQGRIILIDNTLVPVTFTLTALTQRAWGYLANAHITYTLNQTEQTTDVTGSCLSDPTHGIRGIFLHNDDNDDTFEIAQYSWDSSKPNHVLSDITGNLAKQPFYNGQLFK